MKFVLEPLETDENGKDTYDYDIEEYYSRILKHLLRANRYAYMEESEYEYAQEEAIYLLKAMTICATRLKRIAHDCEDSIEELQKKIIEENRENGYLEVW